MYLAATPDEVDRAGWATKDADGYRTKNGKRLVASLPVAESATPTPLNDLIQAEGKKIERPYKRQGVVPV